MSITSLNYAPNAVIKTWSDLYRMKKQTAYWRYFSRYSPRNATKNETTIGISVGRSCRWLCVSSELSLDFGGSSSVSFSHLQSDFPYTIFTPFRCVVVWNCMKLYSGCLCEKHLKSRNIGIYGAILRYRIR